MDNKCLFYASGRLRYSALLGAVHLCGRKLRLTRTQCTCGTYSTMVCAPPAKPPRLQGKYPRSSFGTKRRVVVLNRNSTGLPDL